MSASNNVGSGKEKRRFVAAWIDDFPCIQEVPQDVRKCLCTICNKKLIVVNKKTLKNHIDSQRHQKMQRNELPCREKRETSHIFLEKWLEDIRFKFWLQKVPTDIHKFCCTLCNVERSCASGVSNLIRHAETPEHAGKCIENGIGSIDDIPPEIIHDSIDSFENRKKVREIEFAKLGCAANVPYRTMPKILKFFQDTDSTVLKHMTAGATKMSNIVRNVLGPSEELHLVELLRKTKFSLYIDETTDSNRSVKWMSFFVSFVDSETLDVTTGLMELIDLDSTNFNAVDIFNTFKTYMSDNKIPFYNISAISCDNASDILGSTNSFETLILRENPLIIVIPCICHKLALAARDAFNKSIPSYIDTFLQSLVHHMNSTKRSQAFEQFTSFQEASLKIHPYSKTWWLGRHACIKKIRESFDSLSAYFTELCSTEISNETFQEIKSDLENPRTRAYLAFLEYILFEFNRIHSFFQHTETRVHLLNPKSLLFLQLIAKHFLKAPLLRYLDVKKIDFSSPGNQKSMDDLNFGPDCNDILDELSLNIGENGDIIREIRENCLKFFVEAASQVSDRLNYVHDEFFINLSVFDATQALIDGDRDSSFVEVWYVAEKFKGFDKAALKAEWRLVHRDSYSRPELDMRSFDEMWKTVLSSKYANGNFKYPQLMKLVGYIRSLPHSNAASEGTFSSLPDISTKKA